MSVQPQGEHLRKAVKWIAEVRRYEPKQPIPRLVERACAEFDLSPKDGEFLARFIREEMD